MTPLYDVASRAPISLTTKPLRELVLSGLRWLLPVVISLAGVDGAAAESVEQHFFLVDVSGSMLAKPARSKLQHIEIRKQWLKNWFREHSNSTVTLMWFASGVSDPVRCNLADAGDLANGWVDKLSIEKRGGTHLWDALKKAVAKASEVTRGVPAQSVVLHVLTDGLDTQRVSTTDAEMKDLPGALTVAMPPESVALGDFELRVPAPTERPSGNDPPKPTGDVPKPPSTPTPVPAASAAQAQVVAFDIQEPRIVSSGQLVHFINKTSPRADAYTWTLRRNTPPEETKPGESKGWRKVLWQWLSGNSSSEPEASASETQSVPIVEESELSNEHPVYQFRNGDTHPRSYSILLTARRGTELIAASPLTVMVQAVQPPPTPLNSYLTRVTRLGSGLGGTAGIVAIINLALRAWELKRKEGTPEEVRRNKEKLSKVSAVTALFLVVLFVTWRPSARDAEIAAQQSEVETAARAQAISRSSAAVPPPAASGPEARTAPAINIINTPGDSAATETVRAIVPGRTSLAAIALVLVTATAVWVAFAAFRRQKRMIVANEIGGSPTDQLSEIERLGQMQAITPTEVEAFKGAIVERLRKKYGIPAAVTPAKPEKADAPRQPTNTTPPA